jgi:hypothetical protein
LLIADLADQPHSWRRTADVAVNGMLALSRVRPRDAVLDISRGCHTGPFFTAQEPPSLNFLARHLVPPG